MNLPPHPTLSPSEGERVPEGRVRGRFKVPMRDAKTVEALHEPPLSRPSATLSPPCGERAGRGVPIWFKVPMHGWKTVGTSHEPGGARLRRALILSLGDQDSMESRLTVPVRAWQNRRETTRNLSHVAPARGNNCALKSGRFPALSAYRSVRSVWEQPNVK